MTRPATLLAAVEGVEAVVQAAQFTGAPVENPARGLTYAAVDRDGTLNLLEAVAQVYGRPTTGSAPGRYPVGSPRLLYMSGITVSEEAREPWNRAKWQAEEAIRGSGLDWTIVRACWAYGPRDTALNRIIGYSDYLPFVPIFGRGDDPLTPVFVDDIGRLFALLVAAPDEGSRHHLPPGRTRRGDPERVPPAGAAGQGAPASHPAHPQAGGQDPGGTACSIYRGGR